MIGDFAKVPRLGKDIKLLNDAVSSGKWTKNLRKNMIRYRDDFVEGMHAHHVFPIILGVV